MIKLRAAAREKKNFSKETEMSGGYSKEKNIQIMLALLKANGIKKAVVSPGATNYTFVRSMQSDPYFELYSCVDERSAAYMACGLAGESGEPVVLSCTGATASRNYLPGLTEAYYRKLPVIAVTSHQGEDRIGQLIAQNIDRRSIPNDIALISVTLPIVNDARTERFAVREANRAVLAARRDGGGPVHINLITSYSPDFSVEQLPPICALRRFFAWDTLPELPSGKIAVFIGSHRKFSERQAAALDRFCGTHDAVAICDHTSGYYGPYRLLPTLMELQTAKSPMPKLDVIIHIGEICAATFSGRFHAKEIWRVSEDGEIRDPFGDLTTVFQMPEAYFFERYSGETANKHAFIDECRAQYAAVYDHIPELPLSNIWCAQQLAPRLPNGCVIHIGVSNTRRSWNMFPLADGVESSCNVGCCGIDGCTSTLLGASLANRNRLYYLVTGDLAFFYDLNALGNRHVGSNIRILLINNGIGAEFKLSSHPCYAFKNEADAYSAAGGHFGNKSKQLVRHIAEDLGFRYLCADTKEGFLAALDEFTSPKPADSSIILEVFTNHEDENTALRLMSSIVSDVSSVVADKIKKTVRSLVGERGVQNLKSILKK